MKREIDGVTYITAAEAAAKLETTSLRVLMLLKEKSLQGVMVDGEWYVTSGSVECYQAHGEDARKIKSCQSDCSSGCGCK